METASKVKVTEIPESFQNGFLVNLRVRKWGATAQANESLLPDDFPKEIYSAVQDLLDEEGRKQLEELNFIKGQALKVINACSLPFPIAGFRFIKENAAGTRLEYVNSIVEGQKVLFFDAAEDFINQFERLKENYQQEYPKYFDEKKYPTVEQLRQSFRFEFQIFEFVGPGELLKKISPAIYKQQMEEIKSNIAEMKDYVLKVVSNELVERMATLQGQCTSGKINQATIQSVNNLVERFDNLYGDFLDARKIKTYVEELKEYLEGTDADMLKVSAEFRAAVGKKAKEIGAGIQTLPEVQGKLKRSFDF